MKIKEAVDEINKLDTVKAAYAEDNFIQFYEEHLGGEDWFLALRKDTQNWNDVYFNSSAIDDAAPSDIARVFYVIQELLDTPIDERFPEKRYYMKIKRGILYYEYVKSFFSSYNRLEVKFTRNKENAATFTKSQLDGFPFTLKTELEEADND